MMAVELVLIAITALIAYILWSILSRKLSNYPPGPIGFPIVGSLPFISTDSHRYFKDLSVKYGSNVISLKLGTTDIVVLNDWKSVQEVLLKQSELFSGRPEVFLWECTMKKQDIATSQGPLWRERKRFALQNLRDFGFGKHSMEEVIMEEVIKTISHVENTENNRIDVTHLFFTPIFSIISKITAGSTFEVDDEVMKNLSKAIKFNFDCFKNDSPLNFMPYLRHIPGLTNFHEFMASHTKVENLLKATIKEHEDTYVEGNTRDFIDVYLREIIQNKDKMKSENSFPIESLVGVLYNLYNAGVETTDHTLSFALLYLSVWPEIQSKVQTELDQLIGRGRFPTYTDRKLLPYTEATIMEILRYSTTLPLSLPHAPTATATLEGYTIPKGIIIEANVWAVHFDADLWGDPEVFRPERFLDVHGNVQKPEYFIPFSLGARFCLGESLARMELFLFFTCTLQRFSFRCITGEPPPSLEPIVGVTQRPQPFSLMVKLRE